MPSLISDSQKSTYSSAIDSIHDTFKHPMTVYHKSAQNISNLDSNYNAFYEKGNETISYTYNSQTIYARIKYLDKQNKGFSLEIPSIVRGNELEITQETVIVRIKVKIEDSDYVQNAEKITIDNQDFRIFSAPTEHGLFDIKYDTFYLRSII